MSDIKWIKLSTLMFDDEKIRLIESMPDHDALLIIWIKLLAQAGKCNCSGYLLLTENIPYTDEMLATIFNRPINTVRMALETFKKFGMIDINDDCIYISNWEKHQNITGMDAIREKTKERVQKHRERKKQLKECTICQYCGGVATGEDHVIATSRGGYDIEDNKVACCIDCNRIKNDKPLVDFLNRNRDRIKDEIVLSNKKLIKYVTLCNVTDRYTVTESNALDIDKEKDKELDIKNIRSFENDPKNLNQNEPDIFEPENEIGDADIIDADKEIISEDKPELIDIKSKQDKPDPKEEYDPKFELFWNDYPRKIGKREAYNKWKNRVKEKIDPVEIAAAARNYAVDCIKRKTEAEFIKHPKTFLGKNRPFEDYLNLKGGVSNEPELKGVLHNGEYVDFDTLVHG